MAKLRIGLGSDFTLKNGKLGIGLTSDPQERLDVAGVAKAKDLKVSGISSLTAYEGFLRADYQIAENTTLSFDQGPVSSLSGEIIVGTGQTVTVNEIVKETAGVGNNGDTLWHNLVPGGHSGIIDRSPADKGAFWNGEYFDLDGSNDVITGESCLTLFTDDTDHTIEMWVNFDDVSTRQTIISGYKSGDVDRWDIEVNGGKLKGGHHETGYFTSTASVVANRWYQLVFVHDHASSLWRVFINTATDVTQSNGGADLTSDIALGIGDRVDSSIGHLNGQISIVRIYSKELSSTEISTNYNLGPFSKDTSVTGNLITHYNASNPSSYPGTIRDVNTTDLTRAGGSEIECLKVYNTFTPPSGGTNERPYAPKPGELYYNYDFKTIEFFDGNGWRQVDNTTRSGRAVFGGGYIDGNVRTKEMMLINIPTLGNSTYFGDLARDLTTDGRGVGSAVRGILGSGYGIQTPGGGTGRVDDMDYFTIASEGNAIDFGNLTIARNGLGSASSSTRGIFCGGATNYPSVSTHTTNSIEYVQISTTGNALDFGDLIKERGGGAGIVGSATRGIIGAGDDYHTPAWQYTALGQLDAINIASKGNSVDFGTDAVSRLQGGACGNAVRGCFAGGYVSDQYAPAAPANREAARAMTVISISTFGNSVEFGTLSSGARIYLGAASSNTRGIWTGGSQYPVHFNEIEYTQFASLGDTIDFGDLYRNKGYMQAATSDSHGGLGGF